MTRVSPASEPEWAIAAACAVASFASDVAGGTFGWRQPLGVLSIAGLLVRRCTFPPSRFIT